MSNLPVAAVDHLNASDANDNNNHWNDDWEAMPPQKLSIESMQSHESIELSNCNKIEIKVHLEMSPGLKEKAQHIFND